MSLLLTLDRELFTIFVGCIQYNCQVYILSTTVVDSMLLRNDSSDDTLIWIYRPFPQRPTSISMRRDL